VVKELKVLAKTHDQIFLATDPDREGEAISWHLAETLETDPTRTHRVTFHEITQTAIQEAFANARQIDLNLVNAQQARRVLDRLVGYSISPILWDKVRSRLSAGRVQSVALRLIVDRENEVNDFQPQEYWSIHADFKPEGDKHKTTYTAKLFRINDKEAKLTAKVEIDPILSDIQTANYVVTKVKKSERKRKPSAPFITSTLQQEAYRKLGFTAKRTMALAQRLYEGIDTGQGVSGLITYMRTDSTNVAVQAQDEAAEYIKAKFGAEYLPAQRPEYKTKAVGAQEAHEAIRPTSVNLVPDTVKTHLDAPSYKLYQLIWQRYLASQMENAVYDTVSVDILGKNTNDYVFRATGSTVKFPGFLAVYEESKADDEKQEDPDAEENVKIPATIVEGQNQEITNVLPEQHFTQPPPRFTEASLVQTLESLGIGRPSTYAPIISTIQDRGYVLRVDKRLEPTQTGILVNDMMIQYFPEIVDVNFTAGMEEKLDEVAEGSEDWVKVMTGFYGPFAEKVKFAQSEMPVTKAGYEEIGRQCPDCGRELVIRYGKFGKFISCGGFPECRYTEPWLEKLGIICPTDGGELVERKTKKGRPFYGCANYPTCDFTSWKKPIKAACPNCSGLLVMSNKREVSCLSCNETFLLEKMMIEVVS
jgi:DNA topoisomerase-1